jgi:RNA polymerase sigma-70 factor (ECF subfamily)
MRLRADRRRHRATPSMEGHASAEIALDDPALRLTLDDAVARLPDRLREVFVLRVVEGYAHHDIASLLGISESSSKVRLHRAIQRLQRTLRESL